MSERNIDDSLLDMYVFETVQNIKQLEEIAINSEKTNEFTKNDIDEIFRIMHTIKGSSAMMSFNGISLLAHKMEDLFSLLRENPSADYDHSIISGLMLESADLLNIEINKITNGIVEEFDAGEIIHEIENVISGLTPSLSSESNINLYKVLFFFEDGCEMENLRAFNLVIHLKDRVEDLIYFPEDIDNNNETVEYIRKNGFILFFKATLDENEIENFFSEEAFMKDLSIIKFEDLQTFEDEIKTFKSKNISVPNDINLNGANSEKETKTLSPKEATAAVQKLSGHQGMITVNVSKLDELMDMIGELVIAESMVVNNPDLKGLQLDNFNKAAHQLHKITNELQDLTMSVRMVPLANTFQKMNRIVRDMTKKLGKEVNLEILGGDIEVDKNIIDHLSDPLMHLVRNSIDHGIETPEERIVAGKPEKGTILLEARNDSGEVLIFVKDDGKGLNKQKLINSAKKSGLLKKPEKEMSDKEIFSLIFAAGLSTNNEVTEYSGRGVGMDVVMKNVQDLGGRVTVDSIEGKGTQFTIKFPMTLAIIDGMNVRVGETVYTLPITVIKESLKPKSKDIIKDPQNQEMVLFRGQCYPIIRLHKLYKTDCDFTEFVDGIFVIIESDGNIACIFADELLGENQVVVKPLPSYIKKIAGIAGCTILGDSQISLILDASELTLLHH